MNKQNVVHTYNGTLFSIKKEEVISQATTWMNLEDIMLSEIRQSQRDEYGMISTYMRDLK